MIFTQPNVGNSLIHSNVYESIEPPIKGVIVRHLANITAQKGRHRMTLDQYLNLINVPGITNVDTRALIRKLREIGGAVRGSIVPVPDAHAFDQLHATVLTSQQVAQVATPKPYPNPGVGRSIVVVDFGIKHSILRELAKRDCNVIVLPHTATATQVLNLHADGVFLSNGPGDPLEMTAAVWNWSGPRTICDGQRGSSGPGTGGNSRYEPPDQRNHHRPRGLR